MAKNKGKKSKIADVDPELLKNSGFDEGEIWRLDFGEEVEYEENIVDKSRHEVPLFDVKGYRSQKKNDKSISQAIEMEEEPESEDEDEALESAEIEDLEELDEREKQNKDYESKLIKRKFELELDYMKKMRLWEASFFIHTSENLETMPQNFFYVIEFGHVNPERDYAGTLKRTMVYTAATSLAAGEVRLLRFPIMVWPKKILCVAYSELDMFQVSIKLWSIKAFTFNQLLASVSITLKDILDSEPETSLLFKKHLPLPLGKDGRPRKDVNQKSFEVHRTRVTMQLNEVFDYDISLENWTFIPNRKLPIEIKRAPKILRIKAPLSNDISSGASSRTSFVTPYSVGGYWESPCRFVFTGTRFQLKNSYIILEVLAYLKFGPTIIGAALISLASVESYPLVRTTIKRVTIDIYKIIAGEVIGNVFCYSRSTGQPPENIRSRPTQVSAGAALISQLNLNERYLVFRLFKCDNLAAADGVTGTSDPIVKVKWDGITNTSSVREKTRRPVYNQNLYFPVRVLDQRELLVTSFRRKCLPIDLLCKGPVKIEVWNKSDTSSILLGSGEVDLNKIYRIGKEDSRCLAEGLMDNKSRRADGKPNFDDEEKIDDKESKMFSTNELYTLKYNTLVLNMNLTLQSKDFSNEFMKPSIHFEMFFIPPLPPDVVIPPPPSSKATTNIWKQLSNRWNRDFHKWKGIYKQWFSNAPEKRNFSVIKKHPQTDETLPLCSFLSPIAVPNLISDEGSLLHWINNFMYITTESQINPPGKIPDLIPPNLFLLSKKGSIADHVLMLCSCLLGIGFDAYVCKGTIENGTLEHMWIMTRHRFGHIQFWEVTNKQRYVLPCRYGIDSFYNITNPYQQSPSVMQSVNNSNVDVEVPNDSERVKQFEIEREYYNGLYLQQWFEWLKQTGEIKYVEKNETNNMGIDIWGEFMVPDIKIDPKELDYTNNVEEENEDVGNRRSDKQKFKKTSLDTIKKVISEYIKNIPIVPDKRFLAQELIAYVPYSTIELVFNHRQIWGNLGNHHPAVISYDLENPYKWRSFCGSKPDGIFNDLIIEPPLQGRAVEKIEDAIAVSLEENIVLLRQNSGKNTSFDRSEELKSRIDAYLTLLEFKLNLDPLYDPGPPEGHTAWSALKTKEMVLKEERELKERQEKENRRKNRHRKKNNYDGMLITKEVNPGQGGGSVNQDPQSDYSNAILYGVSKEEDQGEGRDGNLSLKCYTDMAIKASNNGGGSQENVGRDFKSEFPSLKYDPNSQLASSAANGSNFAGGGGNKEFVNSQMHSSSNMNYESQEKALIGSVSSIHGLQQNKGTKEFARALKSEMKHQVLDVPQKRESDNINIIANTETGNGMSSTFTMGKVPNKKGEEVTNSKKSMEEEILSMGEKKRDDEEESERRERDSLLWNALMEKGAVDEFVVESELPEKGVDLSKIGFRARITNWERPENDVGQDSKESIEKGEKSTKKIQLVLQKDKDSQVKPGGETKKEKKHVENSDDSEDEGEEILPPPWRKLNRPFKYVSDQMMKWNWYYRMEQIYYDWQSINFPTFPMNTFTGFPIHFSTADSNDIRSFIVGAKRFEIFIELPQDEAHFFVYPKIFPLVGGVLSTWIFLGVHIPWTVSLLSGGDKRVSGDTSLNVHEIRKGIENGNEMARKRRNKLHRFSKYWLNKYGIPREIPPSSWCSENGVVVSIPVSNSIIKLLNEKIRKTYNKEIPVVTEEMMDENKDDFSLTRSGDLGGVFKNSELLTSKGMRIACNGTILIAKSFYELKDNKRSDSLIVYIEYSNTCNLVYEYSTEKYRYKVYKIDPFDRFLWKEQTEGEKERIRLRRNKLNAGSNNVRTPDRGRRRAATKEEGREMRDGDRYEVHITHDYEADDDLFWEFELPSKLSIVVVCICGLSEGFTDLNVCYSNVKWYKTVRGRLVESELSRGGSDTKRYLANSELRDATMYGMLLSTLFTAGIDNNVNVPNDESEHIFDNRLDVIKNSINDLDYLKRIHLWPNYCEYDRIKELDVGMNVRSNDAVGAENSVLILNGCPVVGIDMNVLLNKAGHLIFSISNRSWNVSDVGGADQPSKISLKCMVRMYSTPQSMETQNCIGGKSEKAPSTPKLQRHSLKHSSWVAYSAIEEGDDGNSSANADSGRDEPTSAETWGKRRWDDNKEFRNNVMIKEGQNYGYFAVSKLGSEPLGARRLVLVGENGLHGNEYRSFDSNVKRNELIGIQPNINGVRSQITGKSMMSTPKVGRESITGGSGNKSYLLSNKQFEDRDGNEIKTDFSGSGGELKAKMQSANSDHVYSRSLPSEPLIHAIFQNVLWRDWLIRYAPLVGENGHFVRVGNNFASGFIGESYIEEAATMGLSYDRTILSFLSGKRIPQLGRFITFGYTDGLYGVRVDRSTTINAWGVDLQARYFLSSTLASFGLREYAEHITVRDVSLSARHNFSQSDILAGQQFSTELQQAIASYKTLFVDVATNVRNKSYGMAVGLRGYQFTVIRNFMTRTTDFLGNWGNGWQVLLSSTSPTLNDPTVVTRAGVGRLGRSFVLAGAGIGKDMIPIVSFQTQLDDVGVILEFSPSGKERLFAYGIEVSKFENGIIVTSIFSTERTPVPLVLGVEPKDLSKVVFGGH
ncbi:c2 containing protein [Cryptosporidium ryanae]|uniref:c2 containing protein n=1 Tax=Cryptosporidium ryanae TaxID=515981 RepID=UPI00351A2B1D|nr:c2 containing protein [Cryptosporidium ryanae]